MTLEPQAQIGRGVEGGKPYAILRLPRVEAQVVAIALQAFRGLRHDTPNVGVFLYHVGKQLAAAAAIDAWPVSSEEVEKSAMFASPTAMLAGAEIRDAGTITAAYPAFGD